MTLNDIQFIFNRALSQSFSKKKLLLTFVILALCGVLIVFFRGLAVSANQWVLMSLTFLPVFLCAGVLLSAGIFLIRIYHDEVKKKKVSYRDVLAKSWEIIIGASYFSIPIILSYLLLWMLLGIFVLLKEIPGGIGEFFGVILAFGPFLINLGSLVLCLLNLSMLFFVAPVIALKGFDRITVSQTLVRRFKGDMFSNLLLGSIALFPLLFILGILVLAAFLTGAVCYHCESPVHNVLQWFFIMIPFVAVLSPAVVFFFNFAAEAHVLIMRQLRASS
jgi:MFS family permease